MSLVSSHSEVSFHHVISLQDLEQWRQVWNKLHSVTPDASYFQTIDWFAAMMQHGCSENSYYLAIVSNGESPIGILPMVVAKESTNVGSFRVLTLPVDDWATDFGPICEEPQDVYARVMEEILERDNDWQLTDLRWLTNSERAAELGYETQRWQECFEVDCGCGFEAYWASRTSKFRGNVRQAIKRMNQLGRVTFQRIRPSVDSQPDWQLYDELVEFANRTWQGSSDSGNTLNHASVAAFFRVNHAKAVGRGMVDITLLRLDNSLAAYSYAYCANGCVSALRLGYDESLRTAGPGNMLLFETIKDSFERGDVKLNMGAKHFGYKHRWANVTRTAYRATKYPRFGVRAQLLRVKRNLFGGADE